MKILYICTHNRCRSILSEAITNHVSDDSIEAYSAGSQPVGEVHPLSIKYLEEKNIPVHGLRSQSWNDFEQDQPDIVVTVCDSAANEACPLWFGNTIKLHWGLSDPSKLKGSETEIRDAFFKTIEIIETRAAKLMGVLAENLSAEELEAQLKQLVAK